MAEPLRAVPLPEPAGADELATLRAELATARDELTRVRDERDFLQMVNDSLNEGNLTLVESLVLALEARDPYTAGHSLAVAVYARDTSSEIGLPECSVHREYLAGLVHDIGKNAVPDHVLLKPGALTDEEFAHIRKHPEVGEGILRPAQGFDDVLGAVRHHHERIDGRGYPDGLEGAAIPLVARVLAVADTWNAMTSKRAYRDAMPLEKARSILLENRGSQHDGDIVDAFLRVLDAHDEEYALARGPQFATQQNLIEVLAQFTMPAECMRRIA
jgi:HD-GYP domain-containing protein (c-di-GMP phosphodiesterase class II)